jgi:hypothetical protein
LRTPPETPSFHHDTDPSLQLYADGSWYCFACRIGGSIFDFAARTWQMNTKGPGFLRLRARLVDDLLPPRQTPRLQRSWTP